MELLEVQDPEKKRLIESSERHKRELEREVKAISERTETIAKNALIIGGVLALTYLLISQAGRDKPRKRKERALGQEEETEDFGPATPSLLSQIGSRVVDQATLILLDVAKQKLTEFLHSRKHENS
ncbi:MAG: hypothetical protein MUC38_06935 [Cyclobacteriaceae bacterium]|jgi:hypothetical protein|nr:hypothetical protein [Cyclobacteriaceae bacterium]